MKIFFLLVGLFASAIVFCGGNVVTATASVQSDNAGNANGTNVLFGPGVVVNRRQAWPHNPPGNGVTNNAEVAAFAFAAAITDADGDLTRLNHAVTYAKTVGLWPWVNDLRLFQSCYHPASNVSFYLKPWTAMNPVYSYNGFIQSGTNSQQGALRQVIANQIHSEVFVRRGTYQAWEYASRPNSDAGGFFFDYHFIGGVGDSNTQAGVYLGEFGAPLSALTVDEHTGAKTNWIRNRMAPGFGSFTTQTNCYVTLDCNGWTQRKPLGYRVEIMTTSNNVHTSWSDAMPTAWHASIPPSNQWFSSAINCTNALNTFMVGSNADWNYWDWQNNSLGISAEQHNAGYWGNSQGEETFMVMEINTNVDQSIADEIETFCLMLQPQSSMVCFAGTSMLNPADSSVYSAGVSLFTNDFGFCYGLDHPNDLWMSIASPGSRISTMANLPYRSVLGLPIFPTNWIVDIKAAGKDLVIITDGGRNDITSTTYLPAMSLFNFMYGSNFWAAGARITYIGTPFFGITNSLTGQGTNLWLYAHAMLTNPFVCKWSMPIDVVSTNDVYLMSATGDHLDRLPAGHNFVVQEVRSLFAEHFQFHNPTNPSVIWQADFDVLPAGDNINLSFLTNNGLSFGWTQK